MTVRTLVVCCHATPGTKGGILVQALISALAHAGIDFRVSDLAASRFNPVTGPSDFSASLPAGASYRASQKLAAQCDGFAPDIWTEQDNLRWADQVVFIFPLRFFGVPALLKGWMERVLARGFAYGGSMEYETGGMAGRTAHALVTAAADRDDYTESGKHVPLGLLLQTAFDLPMRYVGFALGAREVLCAVEQDSPDDFAMRATREARRLAVLISSAIGPGSRANENPFQG